jgi:hypothetical protein
MARRRHPRALERERKEHKPALERMLADIRQGQVKLSRWDPRLVAYFQKHRRDWEEGRFRLEDFAEQVRPDGSPLWYRPPLGHRVVVDKANLFDLVGYRPGRHQCAFHASLAKFRIYSGGARAGKSKAAGMEAAPIVMSPGTQTWLVGPQYNAVEKEFGYIREVLRHPKIWSAYEPNIVRDICNVKTGDIELRIEWPEGEVSWVRGKSAQKEETLLSEELDCIVLCEGAKLKRSAVENKLMMRLATRRGIMIIPSTPSGMGWMGEYFAKGVAGSDPDWWAINADSRMNPQNDLDEIRTLSAGLSDEDFDEQIRGIPTPKHGRVYSDFDQDIHVGQFDTMNWPMRSWRYGRAIDFGWTDPFVILWIAMDEDGRFYVYDEFYAKKVQPHEAVREIGQREGWKMEDDDRNVQLISCPRPPSFPTIADWDASSRAQMASMGLDIVRADKDIVLGIQSVTDALRMKGDGKPRLFIHPRCENTIREFLAYEWDEKDNKPKDADNHAMDALRYFIHTLQPRKSVDEVRSFAL